MGCMVGCHHIYAMGRSSLKQGTTIGTSFDGRIPLDAEVELVNELSSSNFGYFYESSLQDVVAPSEEDMSRSE